MRKVSENDYGTQVISEKKFKEYAGKISESFKNSVGIKEAVSFFESIGSQKN